MIFEYLWSKTFLPFNKKFKKSWRELQCNTGIKSFKIVSFFKCSPIADSRMNLILIFLWRHSETLIKVNILSLIYSRWWQVHLGDAINVQAVAISISPGSFQKFTIFVIGTEHKIDRNFRPSIYFSYIDPPDPPLNQRSPGYRQNIR